MTRMRALRSVIAALAVTTLVACSSAGNISGDTPTAAATGSDTTSATEPSTDAGGVISDTTEAESTADASDETTPETAETTDTDSGIVDALSLTGPADVPDVPDMQPVITGATPQLPATVTDSEGKEITVKAADRVIALDLYGTLVDTIIGLGLTDRLVGRGVSDTQEAIKDLPIVSLGGIDLNIEAVLSLHPDVVLTNMTIGSRPLYDQLESAGVTVVRFDTVPSIAGIPDEVHRVGEVFGLGDEADQLAAHTEQRLDEVRAEIARLREATPVAPRTIVVYVRGSGGIFFIFGPDYGAGDVLAELGLDDVAAAAGITGLIPANAESLIDLDPQIVLTMRRGLETAGGVDGLLARPGMAGTAAGQSSRIITAADSQLLSYGPRTPDNLLALARTIYTDDASH